MALLNAYFEERLNVVKNSIKKLLHVNILKKTVFGKEKKKSLFDNWRNLLRIVIKNYRNNYHI